MSENCFIITFTREKFTLHFRNLSLYETYPSSNESFLKVQSCNFENYCKCSLSSLKNVLNISDFK